MAHFLRRQINRFSTLASSFPSELHAFHPQIRRLAKSRRFADIESLLEPLKLRPPAADPSSRQPHLSSIIASYASAGMLDHALRTFSSLPTVASLNALLSACNHSKTLSPRVPSLLPSLSLSHSLSPDNVSYGILIKSHCLARDSSKALLLLNEMEEKGIEITAVSYTTIMDSLYKEGKAEEAERVWKEMGARNVRPDVAAYNVRATASGEPEDVLGLMEEMRAEGMEPDIFTYNYLMICYCRRRRADDAKRVYREIVEKGCRPNAATYKNLLHGLCKNGDFAGGVEVFEDCVKEGRVPDLGSVMMLVKGLMRSCKVRAAKGVVIGLRKKFPDDFGGSWRKLEDVVGFGKDVAVVPDVED